MSLICSLSSEIGPYFLNKFTIIPYHREIFSAQIKVVQKKDPSITICCSDKRIWLANCIIRIVCIPVYVSSCIYTRINGKLYATAGSHIRKSIDSQRRSDSKL